MPAKRLRPASVIEAVDGYYRHSSACVGRSNHKLAEEVTRACEESRSRIAKFLHASKKEEIIFTRNTTEGINLVAHSLDLKAGDIVLISDKEHNSNLIPWQMASKRVGIEVQIIPTRRGWPVGFGRVPENAYSECQAGIPGDDLQPGWSDDPSEGDHPGCSQERFAGSPGCRPINTAFAIGCTNCSTWISWRFPDTKCLDLPGSACYIGKYSLLEKMEPFLVGGETVAISTYYGLPLPAPAGKI